jgi:hypothetical protein
MSRYLDVEIGNKKLPPIGAYWQHTLLPLDEALQPVMSCFDQLDRSIHEAKNQCCYPSKHNLTREDSAAVFLYTMDGGDNSFYKVLNEALRSENRRALRSWFGFLKLFDTALAKLPTVQKCVWRGVNGNISQQLKKGETVTWWNVSSCSVSLEVVQDFLGSDKNATLFMIEAKKAKDISGYTSFPDEKEVLLAPGTRLYVESNALHHQGGLHVVHLVEVQDGHEAQLSTGINSMSLSSESEKEGASGKYKMNFFIKHYYI